MPSQMILPITNLHPSHSLLEKPNSTSDDDPITITTTTTTTNSLLFEDEKAISIKPLLSRTLSYTNTNTSTTTTTSATYYQQRRRRIASENSLSSLSSSSPDRRNSFGHDVGHAASETFLITRLSWKLLRYLGVGYKWITRFLALSCYSFLLFPGFFQVGYYYFFSSQVRRSIVYGDQPRNRLDLYLPKNNDGPKPVIAFVTGGAWIIGYKAWGCLLGQQLSERDIIVACIDYRNFPQGTMSDMVKDASQGISFVCNNIAEYGGDPDRYNLFKLVDYFHSRGLYRSIFLSIMEGEKSLERFSPEVVVQNPNIRNAVSLLPPIILFHGTADYSIPFDARSESALD